AAPGDVEQPTHHPDGIVGLLRLDEAEPYLLSRAKKAVAFFKISTSMRKRSLSRRRFASSSCSELFNPVFFSASSFCFQSHNGSACTPSSRAICFCLFPLVSRSRPASRLNSLLNFRRGMGPP